MIHHDGTAPIDPRGGSATHHRSARRRALSTLALGTALIAVTACGAKPDTAAAAATGGDTARGRGAGGGGGGGGGGRGASNVMLSANDISTVQRGTIEDAVPVTGDLKPIEVIDVRARIDGDLDAVLVREGQRVGSGQLLAQFEASAQQSDRASAEADLSSARSALSTASWNAQQSADLFKAGAIAERDLRTAQQDEQAAKARVAAANARLRATSITTRDTRVVSPSAGTVEKRLVAPGEHVTRGSAMFTVVRGDVLELSAGVPARLAGDVRVGQVVHFVADGRRFDGKVARISPTVDPATRAVTVYVQIPNPNGTLRGNTFAAGRVVARTINDALLIPSTAVRQSNDSTGKSYVFKIVADKLVRTPIVLGVVDEAQVLAEVVSGLEAGDRVIAGNVGTLGNGMSVQILDADRGGRNGGAAPRADVPGAAAPGAAGPNGTPRTRRPTP